MTSADLVLLGWHVWHTSHRSHCLECDEQTKCERWRHQAMAVWRHLEIIGFFAPRRERFDFPSAIC